MDAGATEEGVGGPLSKRDCRRFLSVGRNHDGREYFVELRRDLFREIKFVDVERDLVAVQDQIHAAALSHLPDDRDQRAFDLRERELCRLLDHPVALAELALCIRDPLLKLSLLRPDLIGRERAALAHKLLLQIPPRRLLFLGVVVELLSPLADHALDLLGRCASAHDFRELRERRSRPRAAPSPSAPGAGSARAVAGTGRAASEARAALRQHPEGAGAAGWPQAERPSAPVAGGRTGPQLRVAPAPEQAGAAVAVVPAGNEPVRSLLGYRPGRHGGRNSRGKGGGGEQANVVH